MVFTFSPPTEWQLPLLSANQKVAEEQSQAAQLNGQDVYLNSLCLHTFLPWFQTEYDANAKAWLPSDEQQHLWGVVTGSAIALGVNHGHKRIVVLPSEASDTAQLEIPQEWVDVPGWAADYFLAVQVDPDGTDLLVWGYVAHQQVKLWGEYDRSDRTYMVNAQDITLDLNALWETLQRFPDAVTQAQIPALTDLETTQRQNLIQRLGNPDCAFPRLAVPFELWAALLNQPKARRALALARGGQSPTVIHQLGQWFESHMTEGWERLEDILGQGQPIQAANFRQTATEALPTLQRIKPLSLRQGDDQLLVRLRLRITAEADERLSIVAQLHPDQERAYLPEGIELSLVTTPGDAPLQSIQSETLDNYIQLPRFRGAPGLTFQLLVQLGCDEIIESFVI